jgi:hypothetical protein
MYHNQKAFMLIAVPNTADDVKLGGNDIEVRHAARRVRIRESPVRCGRLAHPHLNGGFFPSRVTVRVASTPRAEALPNPAGIAVLCSSQLAPADDHRAATRRVQRDVSPERRVAGRES